MHGVGYPVMYKAIAGNYVLWFLLVLAAGKILACSLTLGIGGSGGVFAPSLFIGVTSGMAFGEIADHLFGAGAGQPALYAVVAMGAVFASAARAPLTSVASVVEMTGDFTLTLPFMLAVAIATATSRRLSYGTIYTTKLLRRGYNIDRAAPWRPFGDLTAADAMQPFKKPLTVAAAQNGDGDPQAMFASESLAQALRQVEAYGRDGLPVLSGDGTQVRGWITSASVLHAVAREIGGAPPRAGQPEPAPALPGQIQNPPRRSRPPRYPAIRSSRSPSRKAHRPPERRSAPSPGRQGASRSRSCATAGCASPAPPSPWPLATASTCSHARRSTQHRGSRATSGQTATLKTGCLPASHPTPEPVNCPGRVRTVAQRPGWGRGPRPG